MPPENKGREACREFKLVKSVRFERLLASTALGLALALSTHPGLAQQSDAAVAAGVPMPNTDLLPPLTASDIQAEAPKAEPQKEAIPAVEAAKPAEAKAAAAVPDAVGATDAKVADQL